MKYLQISEATCAFFDDCMGRKKKSFIEHNTGSKEGESVEEREKGGGGKGCVLHKQGWQYVCKQGMQWGRAKPHCCFWLTVGKYAMINSLM